MKAFNWQDFLARHPVFSSLTQGEVAQLLKTASQERAYSQGSVVVREGESGDSLFLIGRGSAQVTLQGPDGQPSPLAVLKAGDFFGEVAVLERRPRSATVTATKRCRLLEIKGEECRSLLAVHPDMRSKVYAKMNERLRQSSPQ
ncbi:MAG TPA: cyclic nucleotide-binding domain-containing protein [Candidatus Binatia bacterium]|nr:cyclic nucleotide-binding domain-containing protein [Candidatus Binatia bacterium]